MKCEICKAEVQKTFLGKVIGTYIKDSKGKKHIICKNCQQTNSNEEILTKV